MGVYALHNGPAVEDFAGCRLLQAGQNSQQCTLNPQPDGLTITTNSPSLIVKLTSFTAVKTLSRLLYRWQTFQFDQPVGHNLILLHDKAFFRKAV